MSYAQLDDSKNTRNQYTFPDGTIVDFGNRDPQKCLDDYVEWRASSVVQPPNTDNPLLDEILNNYHIMQLQSETKSNSDYYNKQISRDEMLKRMRETAKHNIAEAKRQIQALILKERKKELEYQQLADGFIDMSPHDVEDRLAELDRQIKLIEEKG